MSSGVYTCMAASGSEANDAKERKMHRMFVMPTLLSLDFLSIDHSLLNLLIHAVRGCNFNRKACRDFCIVP